MWLATYLIIKGMLKHKRTYEPQAMIDVLIIGVFIEARYLLKSESRHFEDYLALAQSLSDEKIDERVAFFCELEAELINSPDDVLRFHSGVPVENLT